MKAIAAMASNRTIGKDGKLPWRIPGDLKFFKKMTTGKRCLVGRNTFESLPKLPDRTFVVFTRDPNYLAAKHTANEVMGIWYSDEQLPVYGDDTWVIGGAKTYQTFLPYCTDLYLTRIFKSYEGDTFFPMFEHQFRQHEVIEKTDEYAIIHYKNINPSVS